MGVEVVSGPVFDGAVPPDKLDVVLFDAGRLAVISIEDIIADRMGQYASHEASNAEILDQAIQLFRLASEIDEDYLDQRIRAETLNTYGSAFLKAEAANYESHSSPGS